MVPGEVSTPVCVRLCVMGVLRKSDLAVFHVTVCVQNSGATFPWFILQELGGGEAAGGSSFASKWWQTSREMLAMSIQARTWAHSD